MDKIDDAELERRANAPDSEFVPAVTSSMIDRACRAWFLEYEEQGHGWDWHKSMYGENNHVTAKMREALEAALYA